MTLSDKGPAPYAPGSAIMDFIDFARDRDVQPPVTTEKLEKIGITGSYSRRTLRALQQLDLLDVEGKPTPTLEKIRVAPSDQLQEILTDWFKEAYKPILMYVEPTSGC